jgi:hypothetical protein
LAAYRILELLTTDQKKASSYSKNKSFRKAREAPHYRKRINRLRALFPERFWKGVIPDPILTNAGFCLQALSRHFFQLIALCDLLSIHGLLRSLIVAFLAVAIRSNCGLRTAVIQMLVFNRSTSALPVHGGPPARCAFYTHLTHTKTTYLRSQDDPCGQARRAERKCGIADAGGAPTRVPKPSRSDQFYVPEFAELTFVVLVGQKGQVFPRGNDRWTHRNPRP